MLKILQGRLQQFKRLIVTPELTSQLTWWTFLPHLAVGRSFKALQFSVQVTTDASPLGWGAHCQELEMWPVDKKKKGY